VSSEIRVRDNDLVLRAIDVARAGADFADALIAFSAREEGCTTTITLGEGAAERVGMKLLR